MPEQMYSLRVTASGEVRDADGALIETIPVDTTTTITETQARALGLLPEETS